MSNVVDILNRGVSRLYRWLCLVSLKSKQSGTITADGTEQTLYERSEVERNFMFMGGYINIENMESGDTIVVRKYKKLEPNGDWIQFLGDMTYSGAPDPKDKYIQFMVEPGWYGIKITLQQTATGAGGYKEFEYRFDDTIGVKLREVR